MTEPKYLQCNRCVMDTSDKFISFDEKGFCNHCNEYFFKTANFLYKGTETDQKRVQIINKIKNKGKNRKYDCVIGISGGVDSCYAVYLAKKLGLRVLAVHMDNGWNSDTSVKNIKNVVSKLEIDYESYVLDWEIFKDLQLSFLKASVPEIETPTDIAILGALHRVAAKYNAKFIISGGNYATEGILPKSWHYDAKDVKYLKSVHKRFGTKKLKTFPTFGFIKELYYKYIKGIKIIYLLNYFPYSKKDAMNTLENELGWIYYGGKHYESKFTGFVQSYILPEKFNIDYRRATFSTQICSGEITRDEALIELEKASYDTSTMEKEREYLCKKLNISLQEFLDIMSLPPKSHNDYPNNQKKLEFIYRIYRKIHKK